MGDFLSARRHFWNRWTRIGSACGPEKILQQPNVREMNRRKLDNKVDQVPSQFVELFLFVKKQMDKARPADPVNGDSSCAYCG